MLLTRRVTEERWLRAYALLALRVGRRLEAARRGWSLDYLGPRRWRDQVLSEELRAPGQLVDDAEALLAELPFEPFEPSRRVFLAAQVGALRALARRETDVDVGLPEMVRECLGVQVDWLPESLFEQAHEKIDRALPRTSGSVAERLGAWRNRHCLPPESLGRLPELAGRAVVETRARTHAMITRLPDAERVDCQVVTGAGFLAVGWHRGELRSTILINTDKPFNLADLLYVVAHEGHPGHIAEQVLKEVHLAQGRGYLEERVRFLPSPAFVLSEGLGLHAQGLIFPDDHAQAWLTDNVLAQEDIEPDGSDFAAIHDARNILFGAQCNAALLAADGRSEKEVGDYLARWGLLDDGQIKSAVAELSVPGGHPYIFAYYHGWELLRRWFAASSNPMQLVQRLLTEQLLPADLRRAP